MKISNFTDSIFSKQDANVAKFVGKLGKVLVIFHQSIEIFYRQEVFW